jgi:SNF2 family DNA or RNA helicase
MAGDRLLVDDGTGVINGRHLSQLAFWGFNFESSSGLLVATPADLLATLDKVLAYLARQGIQCETTDEIRARQAELAIIRGDLDDALRQGARFKDGDVNAIDTAAFLDFVATQIARRPKQHQLKAALHLLAVKNGANFSVPGSGKTTVVLTAFQWLKAKGQVDALFVVGPPSCFGPWQQEYRDVLGSAPKTALLAGGAVGDRRSTYASRREDLCDLYLTSYQTLQHDWEHVRQLFSEAGARFYLVVDEAHYIKQLDGVWANAVLNVARRASYRCVLTGTPFPRTFSDAFNLFDVLWPQSPPLSHADRGQIEYYTQKKDETGAVALLSRTVGPLFYRVRKSDLV